MDTAGRAYHFEQGCFPSGALPSASPICCLKTLSGLLLSEKRCECGKCQDIGPAASTIASRIAVFLCSAFLFAAVIERYHCSARRIGEACDDLGRDGLGLDGARSLGMRCGPDTLLKAFERKFAFL